MLAKTAELCGIETRISSVIVSQRSGLPNFTITLADILASTVNPCLAGLKIIAIFIKKVDFVSNYIF